MAISDMPRRFRNPAAAVALFLTGLSVAAQQSPSPSTSAATPPAGDQAVFVPVEFRAPDNGFSVGLRMLRKARVTFTGMGANGSSWNFGSDPNHLNPGETAVMTRRYNDGYVSIDTRTTLAGAPVNDGMTNTWQMTSGTQVVGSSGGAGTGSVAFHAYYTGESTATASNGSSTGWDLEYVRRLGGSRIVWGVAVGCGLSDINARTHTTFATPLMRVVDVYSLAGATAPTGAYTAPSTATVPMLDPFGNPVLNPDGSQRMITVDTTVLLTNRPVRTRGASGTTPVDGAFEVRGSLVTARFGPYVETALCDGFALRASAGMTVNILGARMRFDERATIPGLDEPVVAAGETGKTSTSNLGFYASAEIQYLVTRRTGIFAGIIHESHFRTTEIKNPPLTDPSTGEILAANSRAARIDASPGTGLRVGVTTRF